MKTIRIIVLTIMAFAVLSATAEKPYWSVRASLDMTTTTKTTHIGKFGAGGSVGAAYVVPFAKHFYTQFWGMGFYDRITLDGSNKLQYGPSKFNGHISTAGIMLQGDFGWKFLQTGNVRLSIYTGPRIYFNFDINDDYSYVRNDWHYEKEEPLQTWPVDAGWGAGIGVDIAHHWHVYVQGEMSFTNFINLDFFEAARGDRFQRANIAVGVGYNF